MSMSMYEVILGIFILVAISLVALIILQQGKGADIGISYRASAYGTMLDSSSSCSGNFMTRTTVILSTLFFSISLVLSNINSNNFSKVRNFEKISEHKEQPKPVTHNKSINDIPH